MSEVKVNKISPRTNCGTVQLGDSGDTITIPAGATITNNGTQTGFGRTGTVDWQTGDIKTANFTAVNGEGYFCNTTSSSFTMTMPSGSAGAIVSIQDYNKTFDTNSFTVTPASGEKINGGITDGSLTISTEGQGITFVYVDSTVGWKTIHENAFTAGGEGFITATGGTITTSGNCKIHTFTGPGTFCVSAIATTAANNVVSYMVVAGGAGGGATAGGSFAAGGGGAGGFREDKSPVTPYTASPLDGAGPITVTASPYPISIGGGGAAGPTSSGTIQGASGGNSIFSTITSAGGGGGGAGANPASPGVPGGSGGGSGGFDGGPFGCGTGGTGNTPPVSPPQGNNGGIGTGGDAPGGGGGGATGAGTNSAPGTGPKAGGAGATTSITASPVTYSAGGSSGNYPSGTTPSGNAGDNTGDGGDAAGGNGRQSANGGSGIVVIRYKFQ